jgi:hypothetical protein
MRCALQLAQKIQRVNQGKFGNCLSIISERRQWLKVPPITGISLSRSKGRRLES